MRHQDKYSGRRLMMHTLAFLTALGLVSPSLADDWRDRVSPWQPNSITLQLPVGTGNTSVVTFVPERRLEHVVLRVISSVGDVVTVEPTHFDLLERGESVEISVLVSTPTGAKPGDSFTAFIAIDQDKDKSRLTYTAKHESFERFGEDRLPISVQVTENPGNFSNVTIYANPSSPLMLGFQSTDGDFINLLGQRDANGNELGFDGISTTSSPSSRTVSELDSSGRPTQVLLFNGTLLQFTWESNTKGQVQITAPNGIPLAPLSLDFSNQAVTSSIVQSVKTLDANRAPTPRSLATTDTKAADANLSDINVTVTDANGNPVSEATIGGEAIPGGPSISYPLFFNAGAPGSYTGYFVNDPAVIPLQDAYANCVSILKGVAASCSVANPIAVGMLTAGCTAISAALVPLGPEVSVPVLDSCLSFFGDVKAVCALGGTPSLAGACPIIFAVPNLFHPGTISLDVRATKDGASAEKTVSVASTAPSVNISLVLPLAKYTGIAELVGTKVEEFQQYDEDGNPIGTLPCAWALNAWVPVSISQLDGEWVAALSGGTFNYTVTDASAGDVCFDYSWTDVPLPPVGVGPSLAGSLHIAIPLTFQGSSPYQASLVLALTAAPDGARLSGTATYSFSRFGTGAVTSNVESAEGHLVLLP